MDAINIIIKIITEEVAKQYREFVETAVDIKVSDEDDNTFKVIANSWEEDRVWDIVIAAGVDTKNYMKNPIVLADHRYAIASIVWIWTKVYVDWKKLILEWKFADSPMGDLCKSLYSQGALKTVSIWFITKQRNEKNRDIIEKSELLEVSFIPVPCDAGAVSLDKKQLELWIEIWLISKEVAKKIETMDEVVESIKSYIDEKFDTMTKEIKTVTSKDTEDGENNPPEEKKVEITKEQAQLFVKALSEWLFTAKK